MPGIVNMVAAGHIGEIELAATTLAVMVRILLLFFVFSFWNFLPHPSLLAL